MGDDRELRARAGAQPWHSASMYINRIVNDSIETVNPKRPYDAYSVPITRRDPGPDGVLGNSDDGGSITLV